MMKIIAALSFLIVSHFVLGAQALDVPTSFASSPSSRRFVEKKTLNKPKELRGSLFLGKTVFKEEEHFSRRLQQQCVIQKLGDEIDGQAAHDLFGTSVSLSADGRTLAVGAPDNSRKGNRSGHVRVFSYNDGTGWTRLGDDIDGVKAEDRFGWSVSLSANGTTLAVGAPSFLDSESGYVQVYNYNGTSWTQLGNGIDGEKEGDDFGYYVSLSDDGRTLAAGAPLNDGNGGENNGHVRVFRYTDGTNWTKLGDDFDGETPCDNSGWSVSLSDDGSTVAVGAPLNNGNGLNSGHVQVYNYNDGTGWTQRGVDIDGEAADDQFGWSVSLSADGRILAVGANENDGNGRRSGHVRVYNYTGTNWTQLGVDIDAEAPNDRFGWSVSLSEDGRTLAAGATRNDGNAFDSGHVQVFRYNDGTGWTQLGDDIDGEAASSEFGYSVSLSADGRTLAIGARYYDGNGIDSGRVRVYSLDDCIPPASPSAPPTALPTSPVPIAAPSPPPTSTPTSSPTTMPLEATMQPTTNIPTERPSSSPSEASTGKPTNMPIQTLSPTKSGSRRRAEFNGMTLEFSRVSIMSEEEIKVFEALTKDWYEEGSFEEHSGPRQLQDSSAFFGVRNMTTSITVKGQNFVSGEDVNIVTYDQTIEYIAFENALQPRDIILLPFSDSDKNEEYGALLSENIDAFRLVETPISPPKFPDSSDQLSAGAIAGIAIGATIVCVGAVIGALKWKKMPSHRDNEDSSHSEIQPMANPVRPPLPPSQTGECQVVEGGFSPAYKDSGRSVLGESQDPAFAEAVLVEGERR